ncbi:helix-turn-helix domain-containing protein [Phenylobacterium sp.]|uniref:helix-turn-helix domain-containing protein n=1 Tax=Phenylobacterium sp. TaxID=1871053 RepID=UPI0035619D2E
MGQPPHNVPTRRASLSQALRALRRLRGLGPGEVADAMGMARRSFEYFEAGRGKLNVDRVHQVAQILDVDPFAILAAVEIRSPQFAVRCAEHKLMTVFMIALQEFDASALDDIARLNASTIISGFTRIFDALAKEAKEGEDFVEKWMGEGDPPPNGQEDHAPDQPEAPDGPGGSTDPDDPEPPTKEP